MKRNDVLIGKYVHWPRRPGLMSRGPGYGEVIASLEGSFILVRAIEEEGWGVREATMMLVLALDTPGMQFFDTQADHDAWHADPDDDPEGRDDDDRNWPEQLDDDDAVARDHEKLRERMRLRLDHNLDVLRAREARDDEKARKTLRILQADDWRCRPCISCLGKLQRRPEVFVVLQKPPLRCARGYGVCKTCRHKDDQELMAYFDSEAGQRQIRDFDDTLAYFDSEASQREIREFDAAAARASFRVVGRKKTPRRARTRARSTR